MGRGARNVEKYKSLDFSTIFVELQDVRRAILGILLQRSGADGVRLKDLTDELRLSNSAVLNHIRVLQRDDLIETRHEGPWGRGTRYFPKATFQAIWIDPHAKRLRQWNSGQAIDWRFPLASRVPDAKAQAFLYHWLDLLEAKNKLPKPRSRYHRQASPLPLVCFVVYGSCARGDAGARSDIDILVYTEGPREPLEAVVEMAHEASLGSGRSPDIRIIQAKDWLTADLAFRANIRAEGLTIYSTDPNASFLEDTQEKKS